MAPFNPSWASEITRRTPLRPRDRRLRRSAVQKAFSSESPTARPSTSRVAVGAHAGGHHDGLGDDVGPLMGLDV